MKSKNFTTVTSLKDYPKFEIDNYDRVDDYPIELKENIRICYFPYKGQPGVSMLVPKRLARLLAKRINAHLDALKGCK